MTGSTLKQNDCLITLSKLQAPGSRKTDADCGTICPPNGVARETTLFLHSYRDRARCHPVVDRNRPTITQAPNGGSCHPRQSRSSTDVHHVPALESIRICRRLHYRGAEHGGHTIHPTGSTSIPLWDPFHLSPTHNYRAYGREVLEYCF